MNFKILMIGSKDFLNVYYLNGFEYYIYDNFENFLKKINQKNTVSLIEEALFSEQEKNYLVSLLKKKNYNLVFLDDSFFNFNREYIKMIKLISESK